MLTVKFNVQDSRFNVQDSKFLLRPWCVASKVIFGQRCKEGLDTLEDCSMVSPKSLIKSTVKGLD